MTDEPPTRRRPPLWRRRDFALLWGGQSVSRLGSQVSQLALPLVAIDTLHAGPFAVGVLTAMETLPFVLVGLPAGAWLDRVRRRPVLIAADVGRAAVLASVPAAWALSALTLAQLFVVALLAGVLTVFFDVAYQSYLPALVAREELVDGNGKLAATESGAQVVGPAVGGALVGALGAATAVLADAVSFVASVATLLGIRTVEHRPAGEEGRGSRLAGLRTDITEGLRFVWREPRIRSVAFATGTSNLFSSMSAAVSLLFLRGPMQLSATVIGLLFAAAAVGGVAGAAAASPLARRIGVGPTILWTIAVAGVGELGLPLASRSTVEALVVAGGLLTYGGAVAYNITQVSLRQAICPHRLLGRMNASVRFMVWGTMPLGGFLGGVLGSALGLRRTLWIAGVGGLSAFLWILSSPVPGVRVMPEAEPLAPEVVATPPRPDPTPHRPAEPAGPVSPLAR